MLVLSRKIGEAIVINNNIVLTVLAIHGKQIRLGVTAPPEVTILREEVRDQGERFKPKHLPSASSEVGR